MRVRTRSTKIDYPTSIILIGESLTSNPILRSQTRMKSLPGPDDFLELIALVLIESGAILRGKEDLRPACLCTLDL